MDDEKILERGGNENDIKRYAEDNGANSLQTKVDVAKIIDDFAFPKDYNKHDHTHCFDDKNPPCGQRIKHYMCCLCEKKNPELINRLIERVEKECDEIKCGACDMKTGTNLNHTLSCIMKQRILSILKGELQ